MRSVHRRRALRLRPLGAALAVALLALPVRAEVGSVSTSGFVSTDVVPLAASPALAWEALTQLPQWWSDQHTWSGRAAAMSLDLQAGGCWCERWGDGQSVMHGQVLWVQPGRMLRLQAALGPLQALAVQAVLTLEVRPQGEAAELRASYRVAGAPEAGLDKLAPVVDRVLGEQWRRLASHLEGQARR